MVRISVARLLLVFLLLILSSPVICQTGRWQLIRIDGSAVVTVLPRKTNELPLNTRERKGLIFQYTDPVNNDTRRIDMDVVFDNIKETYPDDGSMHHLFGISVTARPSGTGRASTAMRCEDSYKTASGGEIGGSFRGHSPVIIYLGTTKTIECGGLAKLSELPKNQDFIVQLKFAIDDYTHFSAAKPQPRSGDITYAFTYRWTPTAGTATRISCFGTDTDAASNDRSLHDSWAARQPSTALESSLHRKIDAVYMCKAFDQSRLGDLFASMTWVVVTWASERCFAGDPIVTSDFAKAKNWALGMRPDQVAQNMKGKLSAALRCLDRGRHQAFYTDVSTGLASYPTYLK